MTRKYISFEEVEQLATIEQLAAMLALDLKRSGRQLRCECPVHGGNRSLAVTPDVRSRRGSLGVFYCQEDKSGGDRIGLVAHCMEMGQQDAAFFIASQFGMEVANSETVKSNTVSNSRATVPQNEKRGANRAEPVFDPQAFAAKLAFNEEVEALGFTEADAQRFSVGFHRGKIYLPIRDPDGSISGFVGFANGELKLPPKWLPPQTNVVHLRRA